MLSSLRHKQICLSFPLIIRADPKGNEKNIGRQVPLAGFRGSQETFAERRFDFWIVKNCTARNKKQIENLSRLSRNENTTRDDFIELNEKSKKKKKNWNWTEPLNRTVHNERLKRNELYWMARFFLNCIHVGNRKKNKIKLQLMWCFAIQRRYSWRENSIQSHASASLPKAAQKASPGEPLKWVVERFFLCFLPFRLLFFKELIGAALVVAVCETHDNAEERRREENFRFLSSLMSFAN